jgi:GDP-L-fucose synthase
VLALLELLTASHGVGDVDDLADACVFLMKTYSDENLVNIGVGEDVTIRELAEKIRDVVYPQAELRFDTSKPDGTPRKVLNVDRLTATGWKARIDIDTGIRSTYEWFLQQQASGTSLRGFDTPAHSGD